MVTEYAPPPPATPKGSLPPSHEPERSARLTIELAGSRHSLAEVAETLELLDLLVGSVLIAGISDKPWDHLSENIARAAQYDLRGNLAPRRFFPSFQFRRGGLPEDESWSRAPLDVGVLVGMCSWLRRTLQEHDAKTSTELSSRIYIAKLEHHSPLLLELVALVGGIGIVTMGLVAACMKTLRDSREDEFRGQLRELELKDRAQSVRQQQIRTAIMERVSENYARMGTPPVSDTVISEMAKIAYVPIAQAVESSFIKEINFSLEAKKG
jgi:hypothetical protein